MRTVRQASEEEPRRRYVIYGSERVSEPCVVFDIDGVLIDSSERFEKSLEEVGATREQLETDRSVRSRFWRVFLSEKYMHLDKPVKEAIELLKKRKQEGYKIVLITGRPERLAKATLKQLSDFGIPFDTVVFRAENYYAKDYKYKEIVVKDLGLDIVEAHDDSPDACEMYLYHARRGVFLWYEPGKFVFAPSLVVSIDGTRVSLFELKYSKVVRDLAKPYTIEYAGRRFVARDGIEALGILEYIYRKIMHAYGFDMPEVVVTPADLLYAAKDIVSEHHTVRIDGEVFPGLTESIDIDKHFSEACVRKWLLDYAEVAVERLMDELYPATSPSNYESMFYTRDLFLATIRARRRHAPPGKASAPRIESLEDIVKNMSALKEYAIYTAHDLSEALTTKVGDLELVVKMGVVQLVKRIPYRVQMPSTASDETIEGLVEKLRTFHEQVVELSQVEKLEKEKFEKWLSQQGIKPERVYAFYDSRTEEIVLIARLFSP